MISTFWRSLIPERRDLWLARFYYFTFMGGWGFLLPFINLFYVGQGLSGAQIGVIASTSAMVGLIAAPIWTNEVKTRPNPRLFLQAAMLMSAIFYVLLGQQAAFWPILIFAALQSFSGSGILPMTDSMAVTVAQANQQGYGSIRLWGSLGWIVTVPLSGWMMERLGFSIGFWSIGLAYLWGIGLLFLIRPQQFINPLSDARNKESVWLAAQRVLSDRALFGFALALIFVGFLNSGVLQFEYVFLADLGATKQQISIAGILSAVVELPFMLYADRIMRRYGAHHLMFISLFISIFLRLSVLALPAISTIMIVRFIGGVSFSLYTVSFVGLISERTASHERGTVLALYSVTIGGLVSIVASPVSGMIFDAVGARWLYAISAAGYLLAALSMWLTRPREAQPYH